MKRRDLVALLGGALVVPKISFAQQIDRPRLMGVLMSGASDSGTTTSNGATMEQALKSLGWDTGSQIHIQYRSGASPNAIAASAAELVRLKPDVLVASTTVTLAALMHETRTIPIVFTMVSDPVAQGFVTSLAHPGGNVTGFTVFEFAIGGKWIGILREIKPHLDRVLFLNNPEMSPQSPLFQHSIEAAAKPLGITVVSRPVREAAEIETAIDDFAQEPNGGLVVASDTFLFNHADAIFAAVARHHLPGIYGNGRMPRIGGLMSYAVDYDDNWRRAAGYIDRILKGANPGDLPIQEPDKYEFVLNEKTAKAQGFDLPMTLLARADELIE